MESRIYRVPTALVAVVVSLLSAAHTQQIQSQKEMKERRESYLQKYSSHLNEQNELLLLRSPTSQHYRVDKNLFIALIYSSPAYFDRERVSPLRIETDTVIVAHSSGMVSKDGSTLAKHDTPLRIQNTTATGCENGNRSWVKFGISSMPDSARALWIEQHIFCIALFEDFWDPLGYDIHRIDRDPMTATALELWSDVYDGAVYEADEWVSNPPDWEWCLLDPPAAGDFTAALTVTDWFGLGFMVKCNEDDADYYAVFKGAQDDLPPYLVVGYDFPTSVDEVSFDTYSYMLFQNYPNPFNASTTISYQLSRQSHVTLKVYDMLGREVATLVEGMEGPGHKTVIFEASGLASGVYYYRLNAGWFVQTKRLVLAR